jgi:hypothetical protein
MISPQVEQILLFNFLIPCVSATGVLDKPGLQVMDAPWCSEAAAAVRDAAAAEQAPAKD